MKTEKMSEENKKTIMTKFVVVPGFSKYEINQNGQLKSVKTQKLMNFKKGTKKFQMNDDKGNYRTHTPEEIIKLTFYKPLKKTVAKVAATKSKVKGEKVAPVKRTENRAAIIKEMHTAGKTKVEIKIALGITSGHYVDDVIWRINNPKTAKK